MCKNFITIKIKEIRVPTSYRASKHERWEQKVRGLPEGKRLAGKGSPKEGAVRKFGGPERKRLSERGNPKGAGE